jgi:hypothetical protein
MIHRLGTDYDKLLLAVAALAAAFSVTWLAQQQGDARRLRAQPVAAVLAGASYEPANLKPRETSAVVWPRPPVQSSGQGWLYEVFTPPVIYYHTLARSFTITPPLPQGEAGASFGLELLEVRQEQYRLQLAGYCGEPGDYLAVFVSPELPGTLLARAGRRLENLGLTLKRIALEKIPVEHGDAWTVYDVAARAVLADDQTGDDVVLDSRTRKFTGTPLAVLQPLAGGQPRELREGDAFVDGDSTYRIERIRLDPPEAVVARATPDRPQPETRVLHPAPARDGLSANGAQSHPFPDRSARELAASGK